MPASTSPAATPTLAAILIAGFLLRVLLVGATADLPARIADEQHYLQLATSLVEGRGFAFPEGPTSLRPPLYPAFVAAVWTATGSRSLVAVRLAQILLALATAWLAYLVGRRLYDPGVGLAAAAVVTFYPALIFANLMVLTETLFALLVLLVVWLGLRLLARPGVPLAAACGAAIAAAALTRSVLWPFPVVMAVLVAWWTPGRLVRRLALAAALVAGFALVVGPWAVRNTRLQRVPVLVDTMGGMNLRMGNYAYTPHDRIWDAVSMRGEKLWVVGLPAEPPGGGTWTEGQKERWARDKALEFMWNNPGLTAWRSVIKFGDFWGLDRDFVAGVQRGLFHPPAWVTAVGGFFLLVAYPTVILLALAGAVMAPPADRRAHALLLVLVLFVCALHTVVFGHPRYRLPLMPIVAIYAAAAMTRLRPASIRQRAAWPVLAGTATLMAIWTAQFVVRDWPAVSGLIRGLR